MADQRARHIQPELSEELRLTIEAAERVGKLARAENTNRAYSSDWADFETYCARNGFAALPASERTLELYVSYLGYVRKPRLKPSSIARRLAAIAAKHREERLTSPTEFETVRKALAGLKHDIRLKPVAKQPIQAFELRALVAPIGRSRPIDLRDRALLLLGFAGALRRSEIVALNREDIKFDKEHGVVLEIQYSKANQQGEPERVAIHYGADPETCPVTALKAWMDLANIQARTPVFRRIDKHSHIFEGPLTPSAVAGIVKRAASRIGLDPADLAAHSLRSGFVTTARRAGRADWVIQRQTRHKTPAMLDRYTHPKGLWDDNPSEGIGL